ncbi:GL23804 [Drosophila persimilis]|uniref:Sulfhydryl oxidase n=1 Tax=Drosophila persimilis TaxID=7234 RepID=B4G646_DROPE|nr:GL23804 [Drosophila persimilis]
MIPIRNSLPFATLLLLLLLLLATAKARARPNEATGEASLYNEADNVINADTNTLRDHLATVPKGKLVQFINIFCGDCQRFAPTFKDVARDLYKWQRVLSIYAVDCAQEKNVQICRDFQVLKTPTLRYFPVYTGNGTGIDIPTVKPNEIKDLLAGYLAKDMNWNLLYFDPLRSDSNAKTTIGDHKGPGQAAEYIALVLQPKGSNIGRDTIFELLPHPAVVVRLVDDAQTFANFGLTPQGQKLAILDLAGNVQALKAAQETSQAYAASIAEYLGQKGHTPVPPLPTTVAPKVRTVRNKEQQAILATVLRSGPAKIYRADLEQAIDKLLHVELPKADLIQGSNLTALRDIIAVLRHLNPLNNNGQELLTNLHGFLLPINRLTGSEFADLVKSTEKKLEGNVFKAKRYVGCIASRPFLRGFTCSLWTLFHYLTSRRQATVLLQPDRALGIHACSTLAADCADHFLALAERKHIERVTDYDAEILWLWEAHNEVNKRLAGDTTEDPKFPKIQFPSKKYCPACTNENSQWNRTEVLKYLKIIYDNKNLSPYGLPTTRGYP